MLPARLPLQHNAYCSAPPLESSLRPPRLSRNVEASRPCAPLRPPKREVRESEASSVEFVLEEEDVKIKAPASIERDPRQLCETGSHIHRAAGPVSLLFL